MQRTSYLMMECPIARGLEQVGECWSILIIRDAFHGLTRFDEFLVSLGIAPNMLSRRLAALVARGLLTKRRYTDRPPRDEYVLTAKGRDLEPVLLALMTWGNKHLAGPDGVAVQVINRATGELVQPAMVDGKTLKPLLPGAVRLVAGPGAGPEVRSRLARMWDGYGNNTKEGAR
jgi:DNA-binding HxlR family transcriptional regulator